MGVGRNRKFGKVKGFANHLAVLAAAKGIGPQKINHPHHQQVLLLVRDNEQTIVDNVMLRQKLEVVGQLRHHFDLLRDGDLW